MVNTDSRKQFLQSAKNFYQGQLKNEAIIATHNKRGQHKIPIPMFKPKEQKKPPFGVITDQPCLFFNEIIILIISLLYIF